MVNLVYADLWPDSASNQIDLLSTPKVIGLTLASLIFKKSISSPRAITALLFKCSAQQSVAVRIFLQYY
ncbi:MAG: hypothetical protein ACI8SR_003579 [Oceanicoccus sp.]|jgi:hypothetical protein